MQIVSATCTLFSKKAIYEKPSIKADKKFLVLYFGFTRTSSIVIWLYKYFIVPCVLTTGCSLN